MRRIVLILLSASFALTISAQDIYKEVKSLKRKSEILMNDTTKSLESRKIACFKNDALYYLIDKAADDPIFTEYELGKQANAMIEYVNLFVKRLSADKKKKEKEITMAKFRNATIQNALFNDMEKEIIYGYIDNNDFITQFSLDTDWVKALAEVKK